MAAPSGEASADPLAVTVSRRRELADRMGLSLLASRVAGLGFATVVGILVARILGPGEYGLFGAAGAVVATVTILGALGIDQLLVARKISVHDFRRGMRVVAFVSAVVLLAGTFLWPNLTSTGRWVCGLLSLAAVLDLLKTPWLTEPALTLSFSVRARRELLMRSLSAVATLAAALVSHSAVAVAVATLIAATLLMAPAASSLKVGSGKAEAPSREILRRGLPYALSGAFYAAYFQVDMAILAAIREPTQVGYYRASYAFVSAAIVLPVALNNDILRPRIMRNREAGESAPSGDFLRLTLLSGLVVSAVVVLAGPDLLEFLFGSHYAPADSSVRLLGFALLPHFFNSWAGNVAVAWGRTRWVLTVQGTLAVGNVVGNILIIPSQGAHGAALMTLLTEAGGAVLYLAGLVGRGRWTTVVRGQVVDAT